MANEKNRDNGCNLPVTMMILFALLGGFVVMLSFWVINYWPQPVSVVPYFGRKTALFWGLIVGGVNGLILGFLNDDKHFEKVAPKV